MAFMPMAFSQYTINGNAFRESCNCYTLTQNVTAQSGSVWNNTKINLTQSFSFTFSVFLGCSDGGADGIAFVLQPISTNVGTSGGGMGYQNINPSVGVTMDTYQNSSPDNDPSYDHIAIQINGDINHSSANTLTPLTPISATNNNVEDCILHTLKVVWDAPTTTMTVFFDGVQRVSATRDFVNTVFSGNPQVYWGFTGATGGLSNLQRFCTSLVPKFVFLPTQTKCVGEPITFNDSTITFGGVLKRYWNFGDGSPIDSISINPTHTYAAAGDYNVTLSVTALDNCSSIFNQTVRVGSKPVAAFYHSDSCINIPINFHDTSYSSVGSIATRYWDLDNAGVTSTLANPITTYATSGTKNIKLVVKSVEGCTSDTLFKTIRIRERPVADFTFSDSLCMSSTFTFTDNSTLADGTVNGWVWNVDGANVMVNTPVLTQIFTTPGNHTVGLYSTGTGNTDCLSALVTKNVFVVDKPLAAIKAFKGCERSQVQLFDSSYSNDGVAITTWWWDLGNGQFSTLQNPFVTYTTSGTKTIRLVVKNRRNCSSDTLTTTIYISAKPLAKFGVGESLCTSNNIQFSDSSTVTNATINAWQWVYNNAVFSTLQNPVGTFNASSNTVGLLVVSNEGCVSDTVFHSFVMKARPQISMTFKDACKLSLVTFTATETPTNIGIATWNWNFGDGTIGSGNPTSHSYSSNNNYTVKLYGVSVQGCSSDTIQDVINIYGTNAFAGNDTLAVANQPIQLNASGGLSYEWTPITGLSASDIPNPIATNSVDRAYYLRAFTPEGCESYDTINIKMYTQAEIYVPNAFTPNGDGNNDILRAKPVGITSFEYFSVYNRYGQLVFKTSDYKQGWDGRLRGKEQNTGHFVWMAAAVDFKGIKLFRKGTVMLIR